MIDLIIPVALVVAIFKIGAYADDKFSRYFRHGKLPRYGDQSLFERNLIKRDIRITGSEYISNAELSFIPLYRQKK